MRRFNIIKKSRKNSKDIDEKIEYLNKECQKTCLNEIMTTSNIYQGVTKTPNQDSVNFQGLSQGGYALGLSGADGNHLGGAILDNNGVALSPPHPVTGVRIQAVHVRNGTGSTTPLKPGVKIARGDSNNPPIITMGSAVWFFDPTFDSGQGKWCNLEYFTAPNQSVGALGFWDTNNAGFFFHNTNVSQHPCGDISAKIAGINFGVNGAIGAPETIVLTQDDLGDPTFLPIDIPLSAEALKYLRGRAVAGAYSGMYDIDGRGWFVTGEQLLKMQRNPERFNLTPAEIRRIRRMQVSIPNDTDGTNIAGQPVSDTNMSVFAGAQDGDQFAFFGGKKDKTPKKPTKKTSRGALDAHMAITGDITPEQFFQKYGMSPQDYLNLPQY